MVLGRGEVDFGGGWGDGCGVEGCGEGRGEAVELGAPGVRGGGEGVGFGEVPDEGEEGFAECREDGVGG